MDKKNIKYITKRALLNLPDDIPIYVLIDPDSPDPIELKNTVEDIHINDNLADKCQNSNNEEEFDSHVSCDIVNDLNDEFINTVDIETSDSKQNNETPDHLTQFYDSLYNLDDFTFDNSSTDKLSKNNIFNFDNCTINEYSESNNDESNVENEVDDNSKNNNNEVTEDISFNNCDIESPEISNLVIDEKLDVVQKEPISESTEIISDKNNIDLNESTISDKDNIDPNESTISDNDNNDINESTETVSDKDNIHNKSIETISDKDNMHINESTETVFDKDNILNESTETISEKVNVEISVQTETQNESNKNEVKSVKESCIEELIKSETTLISPPIKFINANLSDVSLLQSLNLTNIDFPRLLSNNQPFAFTSVPPPGYHDTITVPQPASLSIQQKLPKKPPIKNISRIKEDLLKKAEEVKKIKRRRRAESIKEPRRPIEFKKISFLEMELNEKYLVYLNKSKKIVVGTKAMTDLEDEFQEKILNRSKKAIEKDKRDWKPFDRSKYNTTEESEEILDLSSDDENGSNSDENEAVLDSVLFSDTDEEDEDEGDKESAVSSTCKQKANSNSTEIFTSSAVTTETGFTDFQLKQLAKIERKVAYTRKKLHQQSLKNGSLDSMELDRKNNGNKKCNYACRKRTKKNDNGANNCTGSAAAVAAKKPKQSVDYRTIQENKLANNAPVISAGRSLLQQAEINHKLNHPRKLHTDIWYNEAGELNDGPACCCNDKTKIGPLHNDYPGESANAPTICTSNTNNYRSLYHYRLIINPPINFLSATPTIIRHKSKSYAFAGFSIFTHKQLVDLPVCQVVRYNIVYQLSLVPEPFPVGFTIRSLDLITEYLFTELLELLDLHWFPASTNQSTHCRILHLLPRFEYTANIEECPNDGVPIKLLCSDVILRWLLDIGTQPLFDIIDLPRIQSMSLSEWSEFIDPLRGTLATFPGKKPSTIRIDQLDRDSLDLKPADNIITFPVVVHMNMVPLKLGLTREPAYKRLLKNFLKLQYLILNRPEFTKEDRTELNNLARLLENFEMNGIQRREFTVEICSDGFFKTGINTDIVQCALCIPSIMSHIRFHFSLSELEDRIKYRFKDKSLLHQALTHPSYLNTNYGTNPDHYQNTNITCGLRHIEYGDKISLYRSFRKKGLSKMVQVMSYMPFKHETRSTIFGNERLECLGDAVIELITSVHLFYMFPELSEGHLDSFRQALVQNHYLADLSVRLGLHKYLLYTHNTDFSFDSTITHARSDAFEAVMAAITLDGGLNETDRIFGSVLFGDDSRIHRVWCELPVHQLQEQFPHGDRHVIHNSPIFKNLTKLEDRLGIQFRHIRLLAKAMTIRKTGYNIFTLGDNQRLEFLGDSVLKYVSTDYLFKHFPRHHEGHLSLLRNTLVNRYTQARVCRELGLDEFIIRKDSTGSSSSNGAPQLDGLAGMGLINNVQSNSSNSNKCSQKPHADLLEAFLGALFVDKDLSWVERFCQVCFWPRLVHFILNQKWNDPKSRLQQCCLTYRSINEDPEIAHYKLISTYGSTDNREFKVAVYFRGVRMATGYGSSIQIAEMNAANIALENYKDDFKQLSYQEKVIEQQYDRGIRNKMLDQFENWDHELVDRFLDESDDIKSSASYKIRDYKNNNYRQRYGDDLGSNNNSNNARQRFTEDLGSKNNYRRFREDKGFKNNHSNYKQRLRANSMYKKSPNVRRYSDESSKYFKSPNKPNVSSYRSKYEGDEGLRRRREVPIKCEEQIGGITKDYGIVKDEKMSDDDVADDANDYGEDGECAESATSGSNDDEYEDEESIRKLKLTSTLGGLLKNMDN